MIHSNENEKIQEQTAKQRTQFQADGAIGEPSDESDFSLLAWDSFSQEIRNLFTVVTSITSDYLYSIVKTKNFVIFIEKREKQNKSRKNKLKI